MDENNHQYWLNKGPWYSTSICLKLHGSIFEDFITHTRVDRYNIMCSLGEHDKMQPNDEDDEISLGDRSITKYATTKSLTALGDTLNFIDIWLKLFPENYNAICDSYVDAMKEMLNKIPLTMKKALTPK